MRILFKLLVILLVVNLAFADESSTCNLLGTMPERYETYQEMVGFIPGYILGESPYKPSDPTIFTVGITIHIITDENGEQGVSEEELQTGFMILENALQQANMNYVIGDRDTIKNSDFLETTLSEENLIAETHNVSSTINVYYLPNPVEQKGVSTYAPDQQTWLNQWYLPECRRLWQCIIINNNFAGTTTLTHEFGHYFNLFHTWEDIIGNDSTSNQYQSGDLIEDTPFTTSKTGGFDCEGDEDELKLAKNYMSGDTGCRQEFTVQQMAKIRYILVNQRADHIKTWIQLTNKIEDINAGGKLKVTQSGKNKTVHSGGYAGLESQQPAISSTLNERIISGQNIFKHHDWNSIFEKNVMSQDFVVQEGEDQDANFSKLDEVEIRTSLNTENNSNLGIEFHDPWFVESDGTQPDDFLLFESPYHPTGARNASTGGVFLGQPYTGDDPVFYSVRVPANTVIPFHNQDIIWYFQGWGGTDVDFQYPTNPQTAVVFHAADAVAEAKFKGHLVSKEPNPTGVNNSRKVVRAFNGSLHLVYEDDGRIWYTTSADDGQTWDKERNLSGIANENLSHRNPAIAFSTTGAGHCFLHVVWSTQNDDPGFGNYSYISYKSFDGFIWKDTEEFKYENTLPHFSSWEEIRPAIYAEGQGDVTLAWRSKSLDDNIIRDYVVHSSNEVWSVPAIVPNATGHPALDKNEGGTHVVWTDGKSIYLEIEDQYNFTWNSIDLTEKFELPLMKNYANPAIACSGENDASITWEAYYSALRKNVVCHLGLEERLLSIFAADQSGIAYKNPTVARNEFGLVRMAFEEVVSPTEIAEIYGNGSSWIFPPTSHGEGRAPTLSDNDDFVLLYSTGNFAPYIITGPGVTMNKPTNEAYAYSRSLCYPYALNSNNGQSTIELDLSAFAQDSTTLNDTTGFLQTPAFNSGTTPGIDLNYIIAVHRTDAPDSASSSLTGFDVVVMDAVTQLPLQVLKTHSLANYITAAEDSSFYYYLQIDLSGLANRDLFLQITPILNGTVKTARVQTYLAGSENGMPKPAQVNSERISAVPTSFTLHPVYPNPFNPMTTINFELPVATHVKIIVYSASGEKVRELVNAPMSAGSHFIQFDGSNLATGLYFCEMRAGNFQQVQKMLLVK